MKKAVFEDKIEKYQIVYPLLQSAYREMKEFSRKKPEAVVNKMKTSNINRLLEDAQDILSEEKVLKYLKLLDDETLPQNSDVVLVLAQYENALQQFEEKYYDEDIEEWRY